MYYVESNSGFFVRGDGVYAVWSENPKSKKMMNHEEAKAVSVLYGGEVKS